MGGNKSGSIRTCTHVVGGLQQLAVWSSSTIICLELLKELKRRERSAENGGSDFQRWVQVSGADLKSLFQDQEGIRSKHECTCNTHVHTGFLPLPTHLNHFPISSFRWRVFSMSMTTCRSLCLMSYGTTVPWKVLRMATLCTQRCTCSSGWNSASCLLTTKE